MRTALHTLKFPADKLSTALAHTADLIQHVDAGADRLRFLGRVEELLGYGPAEYPRSKPGLLELSMGEFLELLDPDDAEKIGTAVEQIIEKGETSWDFRYRIRAKDGSYRHWIDRGTIIGFVDGRGNEAIGAVIDETAEVRARQQLQRALAKSNQQSHLTSTILNSIKDHVAVLNSKGTVIEVNDAWRVFARESGQENHPGLGVGADYLAVCRDAAKIDPLAAQALAGIHSVLDGTLKTFNLEYPCHGPSSKNWFSMVASAMKDGHGCVISHADVTDRVLARQELRRALTEVQQLKSKLEAETHYLQQEISAEHGFHEIIGRSPSLLATLDKTEVVSATNSTVLLLGETGTGKELLARAIHARSSRKDRPLIKVDCGTLPSGLIESELFGHEKGAFTGAHESKTGRFELADGGTIFLDEIGNLPLDLQPRLLRALEDSVIKRVGGTDEYSVDVRVIAATNHDLKASVDQGRFRSDLYYRVSVFPIESPPLRERRDDIPMLASFFVSRYAAKMGKPIDSVSQSSMDALVLYDWPGNVRELRNVIQRAVILCSSNTLHVTEALGDVPARSGAETVSLGQDLVAIERSRIVQALEESGWKIKGAGNAAERLGLPPSTLRSRIKKLEIAKPAIA